MTIDLNLLWFILLILLIICAVAWLIRHLR